MSPAHRARLALLTGLLALSALAAPADAQVKSEAKSAADPARRTALVPPRARVQPYSGPNPCMTPDPGFGAYDRWEKLPVGQFIAPRTGGITKSGQFDMIVHFHGHEAVRKEFVKTATGQVLVGVDLGIGSGAYEQYYADPRKFEQLIDQVEKAMSRRHNRPCRVRKLALSSWSAGYGATWRILMQPAGRRVDTVLLFDSLHAGYVDERAGKLKTFQLDPFVRFAREAAAGRKMMFLSHSSIVPPGYASTAQVAQYVVEQVQGRPRATRPRNGDPLGLELYSRYDRGLLYVRGFGGNDKPDHCAHLGLMADVMQVRLAPRWRSPRAGAASSPRSR